MQSLVGKKILIGVAGGIAAYKIPLLVRLLVKAKAEIRIIMTKDAENFVTAQTLSVLSKNKVEIGFFDANAGWNNHVELGLWPDLMVIAPATANTLAKMAHGICDNLLMAAYMSSRCQVVIAPAMDEDMYLHFSTAESIAALQNKGTLVIPPDSGELASGLTGVGRMAEPEQIFSYITSFFRSTFKGKKVLINAGPTHEPVDPVRFIGNRSSGKTGIYIAEAFALLGAEVTLVLGPSNERVNESSTLKVNRVNTAQEMHGVCMNEFAGADIFIASAAVADYRVEKPAENKIKKSGDTLELKLVKNPDIIAEAGKTKRKDQVLVGFALETNNVIENAKSKLVSKNLDLVIMNSPNEKGEGFGYDTNRISILDKHNKIANFELKHKRLLAFDIAAAIYSYIKGQ